MVLDHKKHEGSMSELMCDNVEALAGGENGSKCTANAICTKSVYENGDWQEKTIGSVGCEGTDGCISGDGWVECDGLRSNCN